MNALEHAEKLRSEHNGIMGVRLFLGHDGHNACVLENYDNILAHGDSGVSLQDAIEKAEQGWRFKALKTSPLINDLIDAAIAIYSGHGDGVFQTGCFQMAVTRHHCGLHLTDEQVAELLEVNPRVVRLSSGCHWLRLPGEYTRFQEES